MRLDGGSNTAQVTSRMVRTARMEAQEAAGISQIAVRGAWTQAAGGSLAKNLFQLPTNPANTSAVFWADKLLALCEVRNISPSMLRELVAPHNKLSST